MSKTKVFYVEDELFLGKIVKESLESRNFEVIMESDGAKATELFKKAKPDICVLPIKMVLRSLTKYGSWMKKCRSSS